MRNRQIVAQFKIVAITGILVALAVTIEQFISSLKNILFHDYSRQYFLGLVASCLWESSKQWILLAIILSVALFILWLAILPLWRSHFAGALENRLKDKNKLKAFAISAVFFFYGGWAINHYILPAKFHPASLIGDAAIALFALFLGWGLLRRISRSMICLGSVVFVAIVLLLAYIAGARLWIEAAPYQRLQSLPYLTWAPVDKGDVAKKGVTAYEPGAAFDGINIYSEVDGFGYLMDMAGEKLHVFSHNLGDKIVSALAPYGRGKYLMFCEYTELIMIDWDSNVIWRKEGGFHHDVTASADGDIYAIMAKKVFSPRFSLMSHIMDDRIVIIGRDGSIKKEVSFSKLIAQDEKLFEAVGRVSPMHRGSYQYSIDVFHLNKIEIIDRDVYSGEKRLFKRGDVLFCLREPSLIGVVDVGAEKIVWSWGSDELDFPHHPSLLDNGNILVFDNGLERGYSRVVELNPATGGIEWEYVARPRESFYSKVRGAAQRLPNGNTLVTESDRGHAFEVTGEGEIVWEFYNPHIDKENMKRKVIYRMMRTARSMDDLGPQ